MYLIAIAWLYVALMMAVAEATHVQGTVIGAILTFVLYGVAPVSLLMYLLGRPGRRRARHAREAREQVARLAATSAEPDAGREATADPVAPVRKEP
jgi:membrane protein implicated in regulation of membrane protease activity